MDIFKCIEQRHSYRGGFTNAPIPRNDLKKIVECGLKAPSGKNMQTTEFVVIDNPEIVSEINRMHNANKAMQQAKAYILCIIDKDPQAVYEGFSFQLEDCAAAVVNMLHAITALDYASVWVDGWLRIDNRAEKIGKLVGIANDKKIQVILPLGIPSEEVKGPRKKSFDDRARFV